MKVSRNRAFLCLFLTYCFKNSWMV